jgi:small subunit ribosomal protein S19e
MAKEIYFKDPELFTLALAEKLKTISEFEIPEWANFVKTGTSKQRPPTQDDFWFIRAASILRQLYIKGVVGVNKLRTRYGSRKDRGTMPDKFRKGSGKIIRLILQQAERAGIVEKVTKLQKGRRLTEKGRELLDSIKVPQKPKIDFTDVLIHKSRQEIQEEIETEEEETKEDGL